MRHTVSVVAHIYHRGEFHQCTKCISRLQSNHFKKRESVSFQDDLPSFQAKSQLRKLFLRKEKLMTKNIIVDLSMDFSVSIVNLCDNIKGKSAIVNQLLRSGTSIGANIHEGNYASSKADFIAKFQIALKECYETEYWLKLFVKTNIISADIYSKLSSGSGKIRRILITSINTAKANS